MPACISDFSLLVRQAYKSVSTSVSRSSCSQSLNLNRHTKPGGWVEFSDWDLNVHSDDGSLTPDHAFKQLHTLFQQGCGVMGRVGSPGQHLRGWVEAAGFQNIHHVVIKLPFGTWPRDKALVGHAPLSLPVACTPPEDWLTCGRVSRKRSVLGTGCKLNRAWKPSPWLP